MRAFVFPIATCIAILALIAPASAAPAPISVTSSAILVNTTPFGPIMSCPVSVTLSAAVRVVIPVGARREIQYKWLDDSGVDALTQTATIPTAAGLVGILSSADPVDVTTTRKLGAGKHYGQLQVTYPTDFTTPRVNFTVTCPMAGALILGQ